MLLVWVGSVICRMLVCLGKLVGVMVFNCWYLFGVLLFVVLVLGI